MSNGRPRIDRQTVQLDRNGSDPEIQVFFGRNQIGRFTCYLEDETGNQEVVKRGGNVASGKDTITFALGKSPAQVQGKALGFDFTIVSPAGGCPGERYYVKVTVMQSGDAIKEIVEADDFSKSSESCFLVLRFQ